MKFGTIAVAALRYVFKKLPRQNPMGAKGLMGIKVIAAPLMIAALCIVGFHFSTTKASAQASRSYQRGGLPIDGVWILSLDGTRIRIRDGRSYNDKTGAPMGRDIHQTGPGNYALYDLVCRCRANMKLTLDGTLLGVSHSIVGPSRWELHTVHLDHFQRFRDEIHLIGKTN
jgi:hypothetical protein